MRPIEKAVVHFGNQADFAKAIGASASFVNQWIKGSRPVSPKYCIEIERVTVKKVTRYQLRPDVFGSAAT